MEHSSIKTFSSHSIAGTREEMEVMGGVEEERDEAEEEEKRVGEGVMQVMEEEEEGRKRKRFGRHSPSPHHHFPFPLPLLPPPPPSPLSFLHLLFLSLWPLSTLWRFFFCTQKLIQKQKNETVSLKIIVCNIFYIYSCYNYLFIMFQLKR